MSEPHHETAEADATTPTSVTIDDASKSLALTWADGHVSAYPYLYLRGLCPCAVCQGHGGDLAFVEPDAPHALAVADVLEVGHYALNVVWADGHRTGIYALVYLRSLCACGACRQQHANAHAIHRVPKSLLANIFSGVESPARPG